jgi:GH18 family chitinase
MKKKSPNLVLLLSIGRNNSADLSEMANDPDDRRKFISSAVANLRKWNLDGLDVNFDPKFSPGISAELFLPILLKVSHAIL